MQMMEKVWIDINTDRPGPFLLIADHASNDVPPDIDLGVEGHILNQHVAVDIGVKPLSYALCHALDCAGILGAYSRLVIDLNRENNTPGLIPKESDGVVIPGNIRDDPSKTGRVKRFWHPYHDHIQNVITRKQPKLLISVHSFTPQLRDQPKQTRPWHVGVLYNQDDRAARIAIPLLEKMGLCVGDQEPYSGKILNATMNRHGEDNGIAYLGLEVRQDQIMDDTGVAHWADILCPIIQECGDSLA